MGQEGQTFSLTQGFQSSAESSDLLRTTELAKEQEQHTLFMGMGDGLALENAGLMSRNNKSDRFAVETERKKRDKRAYERALDLMSKRLNDIQAEMSDIEQNISDSRVIIAKNQTDIDFIRSLDTDNLHSSNGELRDDVTALLKKHGYDDLEGKSEDDIRHMLTAIEVQAIEQNGVEAEKIAGWLDRHSQLRQDAQDVVKGNAPKSHQSWANDITGRDPELLARKAVEAYVANNVETAEHSETLVVEAKVGVESNGFSF